MDALTHIGVAIQHVQALGDLGWEIGKIVAHLDFLEVLVYCLTKLPVQCMSFSAPLSDQLRFAVRTENLFLQMHCPAASFMPAHTVPNHVRQKSAKP